jgi:hypothetical protein
VKTPRLHSRLSLTVLLLGGLIACTCVALDVDIGQMLSAVLQVVTARSPEQTRRPLREIIVSAGDELSIAGNTQTMTHLPPDELARRLAWAGLYQQDGWLAFRGANLQQSRFGESLDLTGGNSQSKAGVQLSVPAPTLD